jgi:hypothetical protein
MAPAPMPMISSSIRKFEMITKVSEAFGTRLTNVVTDIASSG